MNLLTGWDSERKIGLYQNNKRNTYYDCDFHSYILYVMSYENNETKVNFTD